MGASQCRVRGQPNGARDLSDGLYTWPEGLAYYLLDHGVRLLAEFIGHVTAQLDALGDAEIGTSWWKQIARNV